MKRFMFGLLASGLLTLGLAGAPAKVEAAPPQTAIHQAAAQTLQPVRSQYWRRGWRRGWYGPRWSGYGGYGWYAPYGSYYSNYYYPYTGSYYYYGGPYYSGYYAAPSYYGGYSYYTPGVGVWVY